LKLKIKIKGECLWMAEPGDPKVGFVAGIQFFAVGHPRGVVASERFPHVNLLDKRVGALQSGSAIK
jgi:hypothetical protein